MKILILGAGALGSNLAALLASDLNNKHEITVLDKDKVEERNVRANTQFYMKEQINIPKTEALQYNIFTWLNRGINVHNIELTEENYANVLLRYKTDGLFIDCFDNFMARAMVYSFARNYEASCLHLGFSNNYTFSVLWNNGYTVPDNKITKDICQMEGASSFIKLISALGSLVTQEFLTTGKKLEFIGNKTLIRQLT